MPQQSATTKAIKGKTFLNNFLIFFSPFTISPTESLTRARPIKTSEKGRARRECQPEQAIERYFGNLPTGSDLFNLCVNGEIRYRRRSNERHGGVQPYGRGALPR